MLGEGKPQKPAPMTASSQEIERHAMYGLAELAHIIGQSYRLKETKAFNELKQQKK